MNTGAEQFDGLLLSLYSSCPHLYDKQHKLYKDKRAKENAWATIAQQMGCDVTACQLRIKSLRERYGKEKRSAESVERSGAAANKRPPWAFMETCRFFDDHIKPRATTSNTGTNKQSWFEDQEETIEESMNTYWMDVGTSDSQDINSQDDWSSCSYHTAGSSTSPVQQAKQAIHDNPIIITVPHPSRSLDKQPRNQPSSTATLRQAQQQTPQVNTSYNRRPAFQVTGVETPLRPAQRIHTPIRPIQQSTPPTEIPFPSTPAPAPQNILQTPKPNLKRPRSNPNSDILTEMRRVAEVATNLSQRVTTSDAENEDTIFGKYIASAMANLPEDIKDDLKSEFVSLLVKAKAQARALKK